MISLIIILKDRISSCWWICLINQNPYTGNLQF